MRLLDTDVMVDILRGAAPAVKWFESLVDEAPGLPGFVVMELLSGCTNQKDALELRAKLQVFRTFWPTDADCNWALDEFAAAHLSHNLGIIDALIAACAVGLGASLCTFNQRHFRALARLRTEQPYSRG